MTHAIIVCHIMKAYASSFNAIIVTYIFAAIIGENTLNIIGFIIWLALAISLALHYTYVMLPLLLRFVMVVIVTISL